MFINKSCIRNLFFIFLACHASLNLTAQELEVTQEPAIHLNNENDPNLILVKIAWTSEHFRDGNGDSFRLSLPNALHYYYEKANPKEDLFEQISKSIGNREEIVSHFSKDQNYLSSFQHF